MENSPGSQNSEEFVLRLDSSPLQNSDDCSRESTKLYLKQSDFWSPGSSPDRFDIQHHGTSSNTLADNFSTWNCNTALKSDADRPSFDLNFLSDDSVEYDELLMLLDAIIHSGEKKVKKKNQFQRFRMDRDQKKQKEVKERKLPCKLESRNPCNKTLALKQSDIWSPGSSPDRFDIQHYGTSSNTLADNYAARKSNATLKYDVDIPNFDLNFLSDNSSDSEIDLPVSSIMKDQQKF